MAFKLGKETRGFKNSKDTPIFKKQLDEGVVAEANMDGTIFVDDDVKRGSKLFNRAIKHEQKHIDQIEEGRAAYGDNWVMWQGKVYIRKNGMIDGPAGRLPEGHPNHPWEQEAINAEKK